MTDDHGRPRPGPAMLAGGGALLVALGVGVGALLWRDPAPSPAAQPAAPAAAPAPAANDPHAGHGSMGEERPTIMLAPEMVTRAGIRTAPASSASASAVLRVPGVVEPNRYKQVAVTSLVAGRITQVRGELGQRVNSGQVLATLYSSDFADQQTAYVGLHAELEAHELALTRMQRLASIGAASRQELDMQAAEHARLDAATAAARSRLALLGVTDERFRQLETEHTVTTTVDVLAPIAGVISERGASVGANIDPATPLFTIVDLGTVWVIGDVYERDFQAVQVGSAVTITTPAYPGLSLQGKVSYIDPVVQSATRTARVRVEIPNPGQQLRLGMYVDMAVARGGAESAVVVPRAAVQTVGPAQVVYVASAQRPGEFVEREVEIADAAGDRVRVLRGVEAGELVVVEGAFYLRAERERPSSGAPATSHQGH